MMLSWISFPIQNLRTLLVDDLTLCVHNIVVVQDILTDVEVASLNLSLRRLNDLGQRLTLNRHVLIHIQCTHHVFQTVTCENTHQIILDRQEEPALALVTLTAGTTTELVVDTAGFMTFCTKDVQTACLLDSDCLFLDFFTKLLVQFLIYGSCCQNFLIIGIRIANSSRDNFLRILPLPHLGFCQKFLRYRRA